VEGIMSKQILLADDSLTIQKVVELTFMDEDFEVAAVGSGDEALSRLEKGLPDIVIADVHMPGASGYEVCRQAKARSAQLPVLLLVGTFEALDEGELAACGANGHLKKPFDSQELLQVVLRLTREAAARAAESPTPVVEGFESTHHGSFESLEDKPTAAAGFALDFEALGDEPDLAPIDLEVEADTAAEDRPETGPTGHETILMESPVEGGSAADGAAEVPAAAVARNELQPEPSAAPGSLALSDADVDRVARRVVELLSPETVREVAWDVVPDLAEIVIKDRIRELEAEVD
jgi:CheY-like chemotaxis protein